jgi:hypothetical protein
VNPERAAEVILGAKAWDKCMRCDNKGKTLVPEDEQRAGGTQLTNCTLCHGAGSIRNLLYVQAWKFLRKPFLYPKRPLTRMERFVEGMGSFLQEELHSPSLIRRYIPAIPVDKKP